MCLAIPGQILRLDSGDPVMAQVAFGGIVKEVCMAYVPEAQVGDYVIVHVGFAIGRIDDKEAQATFSLLSELGDLGELGSSAADAVSRADVDAGADAS